MSLSMTEKAANRVRHFLDKRGSGVGVRVGIKTSGCSGFSYTMDYVDEIGADDEVFESNGAKLIVERKYLVFLDGMQLDYVREGINEAFKFINPNAKSTCGCGESFNV